MPLGLVHHVFKMKIVTLRHTMSQTRGSELSEFYDFIFGAAFEGAICNTPSRRETPAFPSVSS
jgi:hypothetical protein